MSENETMKGQVLAGVIGQSRQTLELILDPSVETCLCLATKQRCRETCPWDCSGKKIGVCCCGVSRVEISSGWGRFQHPSEREGFH